MQGALGSICVMTVAFGPELKRWRSTRRLSQLDLSIKADVSSKHISFLESGRSKPSRDMIIHLSETLDIPKSERNGLLKSAGFASTYVANDLSSDVMKPIRSALSWSLERHNPYPGFVMDRHWNIVEANSTAATMLQVLGQPKGLGMLDLLLGDTGLRDQIDNWDEVSAYMLGRLKTEREHLGGEPKFDDAIEQLLKLRGNSPVGDRPASPVVAMQLTIGELRLSVFSSLAVFGAANDFALADLKVELFFPSDDTTRLFFENLPQPPTN